MTTNATVDVVMPQLGTSVSEGTVTRWLKSVGETVALDEPLLEISTDKVDTEVPSPAGGVLKEILVPEGGTVAVQTTIAVIEPGQEAAAAAPLAPAAEPLLETEAQPQSQEDEPSSEEHEGKTVLSPVVARMAAEHGVDVSQLEGSGQGGRVTKKDLLAHLEQQPPAPAPSVQADTPPPSAPPPAATTVAPTAPELADGETVERMTAMRRGIAEHMRRSLDTAAHVTTAFEVDMAKAAALRERLKGDFASQHGVKLTYLSFIARATIDAIRRWPWMNAELRDDSVVVKHYVNLGIAVALDGGKGLIVPVIKHAEERNLLGIARAIEDLGSRARAKKLVPDDVQGGTFTVTNPGVFGTIFGTPIINQPQVAILDVGAIVKRPVIVSDELGNDTIAIRPIMHLGLSYDHRVVDGAYAAQFMRDLKTALETWDEDAY